MNSSRFDYAVLHVTSKKASPYGGDWLFGRVQGFWDGQKAIIYALPGASEEEIALATWHEKAHAHFGHPAEFPDMNAELTGEVAAWKWTLGNLPPKYRTRHVLKEIIRATSLS